MNEPTEQEAISALVKAQSTEMGSWSEERRKDFVKTFEDRAKVAKFLCRRTAQLIWEKAQNKRYVSPKHNSKIGDLNDCYRMIEYGGHHRSTVGGRDVDELHQIAHERANRVLEELPPLRQAVMVIDPETAKKMAARDALLTKIKALKDQLEELSGPIRMVELDQSMTIGEFRKMVKEREKKRFDLVRKMEDYAEEGNALDQHINKRLYEGLPGLSVAVVNVVKDYNERATAMDATNRRVAERVLFGDSKTALELLKSFEQDEVEVSSHIKAEFKEALNKLNLAGKKLKAKK